MTYGRNSLLEHLPKKIRKEGLKIQPNQPTKRTDKNQPGSGLNFNPINQPTLDDPNAKAMKLVLKTGRTNRQHGGAIIYSGLVAYSPLNKMANARARYRRAGLILWCFVD